MRILQIFFAVAIWINSSALLAQYIPPDIDFLIEEQTKNVLKNRFPAPEGYTMARYPSSSFSSYLQNLLLQPVGTPIKYYDGSTREIDNQHIAVINNPIGNQNLHQCADAIMRLRAEYLWSQRKYNEIKFNFVNGFEAQYSRWIKGERIVVNGNKCFWKTTNEPSNTFNDLQQFLKMVYIYAGTLSLEKELTAVAIENIEVGDVFIVGGSPGHAVIVVNKAVSATNPKDIIICLAQSYMPAQETHLLGCNDFKEKAWFRVDLTQNEFKTPDWLFNTHHLKRF